MSFLVGFTQTDAEVIAQCSPDEKKKLCYELVSLVIQFIVVFSAFAGATWVLTESYILSFLLGVLFAVAVWMYESSGINFLRLADKESTSKFWKALVFRLCVSVLIAFVVSKNLEVILYKTVIKQMVTKYETNANENVRVKANSKIEELKQLVDIQLEALNKENELLTIERDNVIKNIKVLDEQAMSTEEMIFSSAVKKVKQEFGYKEADGTEIDDGRGLGYKAEKAILRQSQSRLKKQTAKIDYLKKRKLETNSRLSFLLQKKESILSGFLNKKRSIERKYKYQNMTFSGSFLLNWWALEQIYEDEKLGGIAIMTSWLIKGLSMLLELMPLLTFVFFGTPLVSEYKKRKILAHETAAFEIELEFKKLHNKRDAIFGTNTNNVEILKAVKVE